MKLNRIALASSLLSSLSLTLSAADFIKLQNNTALNQSGAWSNGAIPGSSDVLVWDSTFTTPTTPANLSQLGGDMQVAGLRVSNVGGTRNAATTQVGAQNTGSANTLTLGAGGIDLSAATQGLYLQPRVILSANQTWNVANANTNNNPMSLSVGEDLAFIAGAADTPFNLGGFTVTKTGAGLAGFSSGHSITNGSFVVNAGTLHFQSGSSRITTLGADVSITVNSGATTQFAVQSNIVNVNSPITLNTGGTLALNNAQANTLNLNSPVTVAGDSSLIVRAQLNGNNSATSTLNFNGFLTGSANLSYVNTAASFMRMLGDNSGYSGTLTLNGLSGGRILRLQSDVAGSAAATWVVNAGNTLQIDGVNVQLGTLNGAGTVASSNAGVGGSLSVGSGTFSGIISNGTGQPLALTKVGPGKLTLTGANSYTGATTVSAGTLQTTTAQSGTASVSVASGATFSVQVATPGSTFTTQSLSLGTTSKAVLEIGVGATGNPAAAPLTVGTLSVDVPSVLKLSGGSLSPGTFPVVAYSGAIGGEGFSALELVLPPRINGTLANDPGVGLNVTITGVEQVRWEGAVDSRWDADTAGDGSVGTANWRTTLTNTTTRYLQTSSGSDTVTFDDSAAGTEVSLVGTLAPGGITVNSSKSFVFNGSGLLSLTTPILKSGTGTLTLANTGVNSINGLTISAGSIILGDGTTPAAGTASGGATLDGTLVLNRPDDATFALIPTGAGTLRKQQNSTATLTGAATLSGPVELMGGKLVFSGGGTLSGVISGPGQLEVAGGTVMLNGTVPNSATGTTFVSAGSLQLSNTAGVSLAGDVTLTGAAGLQVLAPEQIADTATLSILGTNADSLNGSTAMETVANVIINSSNGLGQLVMRNGFTVSNLATLNSGILGAASSHTATLNALTMTGGTLRVAGSGGPSVLNIGPGGITASGGVIEVKFNVNNQDATLNLGGDFTATANIAINNAAYAGANLNVINLLGERSFNIADTTTTTVAPDLGGSGTLTKTGGGTLVLAASCSAAHTGGTTVAAGELVVNGTIGDVTVSGGASRLGGTGTAGNVTAATGAVVSPGQGGVGRLSLGSLTLAADTRLECEAISNGNSDSLSVSGNLVLAGTVALISTSGYTPAAGDTFDLFDAQTVDATGFNVASGLILPKLADGLVWNTSTFTTNGVISVASANPYLEWKTTHFNQEELGDTTISGDSADPDLDGIPNLLEFALGTLPRARTEASYLPAASLSNGTLRLSFKRKTPAATGVTLSYETSERSNGGWTASTGHTVQTQNNGDGSETVTVTFPDAATANRFARVVLSL